MNILQIGCNDCNDHVYEFVFKNQNSIKKLILVDALPKCTEIAKNVYDFFVDKDIINKAIGVENKMCKFFFPKDHEDSAHASLNESHLKNHEHQNIDSIDIECIDINDFLEKLPPIDRMYIDLEGLDADVLLHLNLDKFDIPYIEYEILHTDGTFYRGQKYQLLLEKFARYGYKVSASSEWNHAAEKIK